MSQSELDIPKVTILTATWNRRQLLPRLYESLVEQEVTPDSFEWLIVDDGSEDGTIDFLKELTKASPFQVRVLRQKNSGKCVALNLGASSAQGRWIVVVDSDDFLMPQSLKNIFSVIEESIKFNAGIAFCLQDNSQKNHSFKQPNKIDKFFKWMNSQPTFDSVQIVKAEIFREFPFPAEPGEKYFPPGWIFHQIDKHYGAIFRNIRLVRTEYQPGGLSNRSRSLRAGSPVNMMTMHKALLENRLYFYLKFRAAANFYRYFIHSKMARKTSKEGIPLRWLFFVPLGCLLFAQDLIFLKREANE